MVYIPPASVSAAAAISAFAANRYMAAVSILDSAAGIAATLDSLEILASSVKIAAIALSDSQYIQIDYTTLSSDSLVLRLLPSSARLAVNGAAIAQGAALQANVQVGSFAITDTAANVAAALGVLSSEGKLAGITLVGGSVLALRYSQYTAYASVIAMLSTGATVTVSRVPAGNAGLMQSDPRVASFSVTDTGGGVSAGMAGLRAAGKLAAIQLTDTAAVSLTWAQFGDKTFLAKLPVTYTANVSGVPLASATSAQQSSHITGFSVSDTAAAIGGGLASLNGFSKLTGLRVTDGSALPITYAQISQYAAVLAKLPPTTTLAETGVPVSYATAMQQNAQVVSFSVMDTSAAVTAALDTLTGDTKLSGIILTDYAPIAIDYFQFQSDSVTLGRLQGAYSLSIANVTVASAGLVQATPHVTSFGLSDTSAHIADALDALNADTALSSVTVTDAGSVMLTEARFFADSAIVQRLAAGGATFVVSSVSANDASALQGYASIAAFSVSDTAGNVGARLGLLAAESKLAAIALTDSSPISVTAWEMATYPGFFGKLAADYVLTVDGALVADVSSLHSNSHVVSYDIRDTAAAVTAGLGGLNGDSKITSIVLSDQAAISLSYATFVADSAVLAKVAGNAVLSVSAVSVAQAAALQINATVRSFGVADTAASIQANLAVLNADGKISDIGLTGGATLTVSAAQRTTYAAALGKLSGSRVLTITGLSTAAAAAAQTDAAILGFSVADTAANVAAAIDALNTDGKLTSIALTDTAPLTVDYARWTADSAVRAKLSSGVTLALRGVSATVASAMQANARVVSFTVTDSAANVVAARLSLGTDTKLTTVALSDGAPLAVGYADLSVQAVKSLLGKLPTSYRLIVSAVPTSAACATMEVTSHVASYTMSATAAVIVASLSALKADTRLTAIATSDGATVTVGYAAFGASLSVLNKLTTKWAVSGVPVAAAATAQTASNALATFSVSDTAANIVAGMQVLNGDSKLTAVTVSDSKTLGLTYGKYTAYTKVMAALQGPYTLTVSGVNAAGAAAVAGNSHVHGIAVSDTLAGIGANLASLETLVKAGAVTAIAVSDSAKSLTVTAAQAAADKDVFSLLSGAYSVIETGTTTSSASPGLSASSLTFIGTPQTVLLGTGVTLKAALAPAMGIEAISNFRYGVDSLSIDLQGAASARFVAFDTSVNGQHAIALANSGALTHGVVLLGMSTTAADLIAHHVTFATGSAVIT